jgi:electron transfer flavoprotein beta subunit
MLNRVIVCLSQSLVVSGPLDILEAEQTVRQQGEAQPVFQVNPADRCALEIALQLKQSHGTEVIALTFAPPGRTIVLRITHSCGADRAIHLEHPEGIPVDGWVTANMIAAFLKDTLKDTDLLLCGEALEDTAGAQVGPIIAELLHLPQITRVVGISHQQSSGSINAVRLLERGDRQRVACGLPALAAVSRYGPTARYPAVLSENQAPVEEIKTITANPADYDIHPLCRITSITRPRPRTKKVAAPSAQMSAAERMKFLMSGGQTKPQEKSSLFEGSPEAAADRIIAYLDEHNLIDSA